MKKIYKRQTTEGKIERFLLPNFSGLEIDEQELLNEFNSIQMHEMTVFYQKNPTKIDEDNFLEEHMRIEAEYEGNLIRIFACNNIEEYIKKIDNTESNMRMEIQENVEDLLRLRASVLSAKKEKENGKSDGDLS